MKSKEKKNWRKTKALLKAPDSKKVKGHPKKKFIKKGAEKTKKVFARKKIAKKTFISREKAKPKQSIKSAIQKPVYVLNPGFEFFNELRDLILKSSPAEKNKLVARLNKLGRVKLAIISGVFINRENLDPLISDLLIVGDDIDKRKLRVFLKATEAEVGKEIRFTLMDKEEFQYRMAMFDRFIRVLLESPHEKLINRLEV
jgi:hypothetical protein